MMPMMGWRVISVDSRDAERIAYLLVVHGWKQISRHYRALARLPEGMTGKEAYVNAAILAGNSPEMAADAAERMGEKSAANCFRRIYAKDGLAIIVPKFVFDAFRKFGGEAS